MGLSFANAPHCDCRNGPLFGTSYWDPFDHSQGSFMPNVRQSSPTKQISHRNGFPGRTIRPALRGSKKSENGGLKTS